jgi:hypothetical protein
MKDVLDGYARPLDAVHPVVCFDEQSVPLLADSRTALPIRPGTSRRQDHEYVRHATRNVFIFVEPKAGQRHVLITQRRTQEDFAKATRYRVEIVYTPVHASWLNIAEIELSAMTRQALDRRIPCEWMLALELIAWESKRNRLSIPIKWSFDWKRAKHVFAKQISELRRRTTPQN